MANVQELSEVISEYLKTKENVKADFTVSETEQREITVKDGKFTLFRTLFDNDVSIKVIKDHKKGTASTNDCTNEAVKKLVDDVLASAEVGNPDENFDIAPGLEPEKFTNKALVPDIDKLIERTSELSEDIAKRHKNIKLMEMFTKYVHGHSIFMNTNGTRDESEYGYYEVVVEFAGNNGEESTGIAGTYVVIDNLDERFIDLGSIEKDLTDAENSLNPIRIGDKFEGDVILTPSCAAQFLGAVIGNSLVDHVLINNTSMLLGKLGEQIASPLLTVRSNPWDERIIIHEVHTADGFRSKNYDIIENGVLKSYAATLYAANKCKIDPALNTGFYLVVDAGDTAYEDMVKGIKKGLIVGEISGGMPSANGEMSGVAKNAFYVEDGEIKGAVMETMISGNLFELLKNIKVVSKEQLCNGNMVMPYLLVGNVTISGN